MIGGARGGEFDVAHPVGLVVATAGGFLHDAQVGLLRVQAQARERLRRGAAFGLARRLPRLSSLLLRLQVPPVQLRRERGRQQLRAWSLGRVRVVGEVGARLHAAHEARRFIIRVRRVLCRLERPQPHPRLPEFPHTHIQCGLAMAQPAHIAHNSPRFINMMLYNQCG